MIIPLQSRTEFLLSPHPGPESYLTSCFILVLNLALHLRTEFSASCAYCVPCVSHEISRFTLVLNFQFSTIFSLIRDFDLSVQWINHLKLESVSVCVMWLFWCLTVDTFLSIFFSQVRLMMKVHSFIRENVPRLWSSSKDRSGKGWIYSHFGSRCCFPVYWPTLWFAQHWGPYLIWPHTSTSCLHPLWSTETDIQGKTDVCAHAHLATHTHFHCCCREPASFVFSC